jgi:hypothetical protein
MIPLEGWICAMVMKIKRGNLNCKLPLYGMELEDQMSILSIVSALSIAWNNQYIVSQSTTHNFEGFITSLWNICWLYKREETSHPLRIWDTIWLELGHNWRVITRDLPVLFNMRYIFHSYYLTMFHDSIIFYNFHGVTMKGNAIIERTTYWTFLIVGVNICPLIPLGSVLQRHCGNTFRVGIGVGESKVD